MVRAAEVPPPSDKKWAPEAPARVTRPHRDAADGEPDTRGHRILQLMAGLDLTRDKEYGHVTSTWAGATASLLPLRVLAAVGRRADRDHLRQRTGP
jgi:hypothetical protein